MIKWAKGLLAAAIGGAGNSISVLVIAPETFNFKGGLAKLGSVAGIGALLAVGAYLKQSPLPSI